MFRFLEEFDYIFLLFPGGKDVAQVPGDRSQNGWTALHRAASNGKFVYLLSVRIRIGEAGVSDESINATVFLSHLTKNSKCLVY